MNNDLTTDTLRLAGDSFRDFEGPQINSSSRTVAVIVTEDAAEVTDEDRAYADRIVACWNALSGIPLETLESEDFRKAVARFA